MRKLIQKYQELGMFILYGTTYLCNMKNILIIAFIIFTTGIVSAQSNNNAAVGVRIGNTSNGKTFNTNVESLSTNNVEIKSDGEKIKGYMIYDANENLVLSNAISLTHSTTINVNSLDEGFYYVAVISESDQVIINTYFKL